MYKTIFRGQQAVAQIPVNANTIYSHVLMREHHVQESFDSPKILPIQIGDYIRYKNKSFYLNTVPALEKQNGHLFRYDLTFEDIIYRLYDKILMHNGLSDFPYPTDARGALQLIVDNINQIDGGWSVGTVDETESQHLFIEANTSCRVALTNFAEKFRLEFYNEGKILNMVKQAGVVTSHVFEYGKGKGLYNIKREFVESKVLATKVYGYGSTRNLPADYRGGVGRLTFEERFLTKNTDLYGIKESAYVDEEIYPRREGTLTAVGAFNPTSKTFTITDDSLDFDISDTIVEGVDGLVSFKTGELAGAEFVISAYDHNTKTITLIVNDDDPLNVLPSTTFQPAVGNKYVVLDINMPQTYITAAEQEVKDKTQEEVNETSVPQVAYSIKPFILYFRDNNIELSPGDRVTIRDTDLGIDQLIRINSVSQSLTFPDVISNETKYDITLADFATYTIQERIKVDSATIKNEIKIVDRTNAEAARRSISRTRQLKNLIFNPDGSLTEIIKGGFAEIGYESQNFTLNNVVFQPNYNGNPNQLNISAGQLIHLEVEIPQGYVWSMSAASFPNLDPNKNYYISARCSKAALVGTWHLSETPVFVDAETGFYHFNLGVLYRVADGYRGHDFTNGITFIVGNTIKSGRLVSIDGLSWFDLTAGSWKLGEGANYNVDTPNTLVIKDAINTGKVLVGSGSTINAGLSGEGTSPTSVRGWAGAPYADRETAPFRFLQNGKVYASDLEVQNGSVVGGWSISDLGLKNNSGNAFLDMSIGSDYKAQIGPKVTGSGLNPDWNLGADAIMAKFVIKRPDSRQLSQNIALFLEASGAQNNVALEIRSGSIVVPGGVGKTFTLRTKCGHGTYPKADGTGDFVVSSGDEPFINFKIINGINCGAISMG